ncbi:MAG: TrkH family potassium uptake protein [Micavibrio sp.]|nr:MAG: TrkH family potassium uptake protein [Micavibrio sp.]
MMTPSVLFEYFDRESWYMFAFVQAFTAFCGILTALACYQKQFTIRVREAFLLTNLSWLTVVLFGALPLYLSDLDISFTDSFFESMSGVTTTGSTILSGLDEMSRGILLWRSMLQWLGGIGIIVMALSILPLLNIGGMQLFKTEAMEVDKVLPSAAQIAISISIIYLGLTALCAACYALAGMSRFDAINHAMTTIATGGYSTHDASIGHFNSATIDYLATLFIITGSLPFILYLRAVRGNLSSLLKDSQVHWFLSVCAMSILVLVVYLGFSSELGFAQAMQYSTLNAVSVITGTGYSTTDYNTWGGFAVGLFFFLMCVGGCAGSTTCGIKIFRFQILYAVSRVQIIKLLKPNASIRPYYNRQAVTHDIQMSVMAFFFLFALSFSITALLLHMTGLDFLDAMSCAVTALANVGPALGETYGPAGNFATLTDPAKWIMSAAMLLGRLELFTLLVMLSPHFWRR